MRIEIDRPLCTAQLKNCVLIAPAVWAGEGTILRAALACQQRAIIVTDEDGRQIWPGDFRALMARLDAIGRD